MNEEGQILDLDKVACKIVWRLNVLCSQTDTSSKALATLADRICAALETGDRRIQWSLLDEIDVFLESRSEIREEVRNVFQLFIMYVHLQV